jgi:hypothetical protein
MKKTAMLIGLAAVLGFSSNAQAVDWNWKGDIRYRYQSELIDKSTTTDENSRDRHRTRVRFGVTPWINEELSAGFQLATGSDETTSRNETYDDMFLPDNVYLNEAYIDYHPMFLNGDVNLILGKRENKKTFIVLDDLVWDGDVTPEGITLQYGKDDNGKEMDGLSAFLGYYFLDENGGEGDPYLVAAGTSYKGSVSDLGYVIGASYYDFVNVESMSYDPAGTSFVPLKTTATSFVNRDFNNVEVFGSLSGKVSSLPWKLYGQYAFNTTENSAAHSAIDDDERDALLLGLKLGKAKNPGSLEGSAEYVRIEEDAVSYFTDSDRCNGKFTDMRGFKVSTTYQVIQNMTIGATYFNFVRPKAEEALNTYHLLQLDAVVKF